MSSTVLEPAHWRARAACRTTDPDLFFTADPASVAAAKKLCVRCPVRESCLHEALSRIPEGVAGGLTAAQRRRLARRGTARSVLADDLARMARTRTEVAAAGAALLAAGRSPHAVAHICGVSERTVQRWRARRAASEARREMSA